MARIELTTEPIQEIDCRDAYEFMEVLSPTGPYFHPITPGNMLFRGHSNVEYRLLPSSLREGGREFLKSLIAEIPLDEEVLSTRLGQVVLESHALLQFLSKLNESGIEVRELTTQAFDRLKYFTSNALRALQSLQRQDSIDIRLLLHELKGFNGDWPSRDILSFLALAQHNGLPTCLLDWTQSSKVAAYFAASGYLHQHKHIESISGNRIVVWCLHRPGFRRQAQRDPTLRFDVELATDVEVLAYGNDNLRAQLGRFTTSIQDIENSQESLAPRSLDELIVTQVAKSSSILDTPIFLRITLAASESGKVLWLLAQENITANLLFPNYSGVLRNLEEQTWYEYPYRPEQFDF